jgi:hypothetical protein
VSEKERESEKEGKRVACTRKQRVRAHGHTALPGRYHGQTLACML